MSYALTGSDGRALGCHPGGPGSIPAKVTGLAADVLVRGVHTRDDLRGVGRSVLHRHMIEPIKTG